MSMNEWGWDDTPESKPVERTPVEPGRYVAEISAASWRQKDAGRVPEKWRDKNPQGRHVLVTLTLQRRADWKAVVYAEVPRHWRWLFEVIAEATGTPLPASADWEPIGWIGKLVEVEVSLGGSKGTLVNVDKWHPHEGGQFAPPKPAATPRTGAAKVAKAQGTPVGDADDVPF